MDTRWQAIKFRILRDTDPDSDIADRIKRRLLCVAYVQTGFEIKAGDYLKFQDGVALPAAKTIATLEVTETEPRKPLGFEPVISPVWSR